MVKPKQLGHIVLKVRDIEKSEYFYQDIFNFVVTYRIPGSMVFMTSDINKSHELALMSENIDQPEDNDDSTGMYHFAWQMQSFDDLKKLYNHLKVKNITITGIGDHGISLGIYFLDPDCNQVEAFYELPKKHWPSDNKLFLGKFPLGSLD